MQDRHVFEWQMMEGDFSLRSINNNHFKRGAPLLQDQTLQGKGKQIRQLVRQCDDDSEKRIEHTVNILRAVFVSKKALYRGLAPTIR